jgi:predicted kinase
MRRLEWLLDGLAGERAWGSDANDVLAPAFTSQVPAEVFIARIHQRARTYAPLTVLALETNGNTARARLRRPADPTDPTDPADTTASTHSTIDVVTCTVEPDPPHRIVATHTTGLVPAFVTPRLPADFSQYPLQFPLSPASLPAARLIVFSGVPGVGKSTLAESVGARLGIPVFATDWLLGALTPFGGRHLDDLMQIASELLTTLALRQLTLGQSAILDHPAEAVADRERWQSLARRAAAEFIPVLCVCSDQALHRSRLEGRTRGIPGWHDAGSWPNVQRRLAAFPPWPEGTLTVDTTNPHEDNLATVVRRIAPERLPGTPM